MIQNKDIFNVSKVSIPFSKKELETVISKSVISGYVVTRYEHLVETLKDISTAQEYQVTLNPDMIFMNSNNPMERANAMIQVEGTQTYREFVDNVVHGAEDSAWTNFVTYSELFKDEIRNIKVAAYKKFLWNYENVDSWFTQKNIGLVTDDKNLLLSNFDIFRERVLMSDDYISFLDCCSEENIRSATAYIIKNGCALLTKHKVELNNHIAQDNKNQQFIVLKHPIITKIFLQSGVAGACRKDWPKIKFTVLDKKSFETIGLWDN